MTKTPFRYAGGKNKLISSIMEKLSPQLQNSQTFCDAFVGGGSILLEVASQFPTLQLFTNDKDSWVSNFWSIVADPDPSRLQQLLSLMRTQPTLELFNKLRETPANDSVEEAYRAIFFNRCAFSGILNSGPIGGKNQSSKYTVDCRYNFDKLKSKIESCHKLLQGRTTVMNLDIHEMLKNKIDTWYLDPPYVVAGKSLYREYMSEEEHMRMSEVVLYKDQWVLSYDNHPLITEIYGGCDIYTTDGQYCIQGSKTAWSSKKELIIVPRKKQ